MARKQTPTLTEAELRLMRVLWELKKATVSDVMKHLPGELDLAYNSVLTTLRILEQKGYLRHTKLGRAHLFSPIVSKSEARQNVVRHMVSNFFNDSPELLLLSLVENEEISPEELDRLKEMISKGKEE